MAKIILTVDGVTLKELPLTKERITIGRRSTNDLVIDHVAISGKHAAIVSQLDDYLLEDLDSTNGTQVNGQPVKKHYLQDRDIIELAPYQITFIAGTNSDTAGSEQNAALSGKPERMQSAAQSASATGAPQVAMIRVLTGPSAGKEITLAKALTTIGRPGVQVAVVTHRRQGYFITHVEGSSFPLVNGESIGDSARLLNVDDVIDLSGTQMVFCRGKQ